MRPVALRTGLAAGVPFRKVFNSGPTYVPRVVRVGAGSTAVAGARCGRKSLGNVVGHPPDPGGKVRWPRPGRSGAGARWGPSGPPLPPSLQISDL
jgi:hypothetical protein